MNYLSMYTSGEPRKLVNSCRKRRHKHLEILLEELWRELERRFGNAAVIANTFLTNLREAAKFQEFDSKKLQAFSNMCLDVASQIDQLPSLACLNYPDAIRPTLYNLPQFLCNKWEKQVVEFTLKHRDAYPDFTVFASMVEKKSLLKNHPNVTEIKKRGKGNGRRPYIPIENLQHTVLTGETTENEEYCLFHKCKGNTLSECKAFAQKTLEEKTEWIKKESRCFKCLVAGHIASQCKREVKCDKCSSERHPTLFHREKGIKESREKEVISSRISIGYNVERNVSCSKVALIDVFPSRATAEENQSLCYRRRTK